MTSPIATDLPSPIGLHANSSTLENRPSHESSQDNVQFLEPGAGLVVLAGGQQAPVSFISPPAAASLCPIPPLDFISTQQQQQFGIVNDLVMQQQQLSTPTMHPNLVSTLKSIISPSSSSQTFDSLTQQEEQVLSHGYKSLLPTHASVASLVDGSSSVFGLEELQALYTASFRQHDEQSHVAVVPVDVIQNRRPFQCAFPGCNKTFKNPQTLKMHHKTHYSEDGAYRKGSHSLATFPPSCKAGHNKKIPSKCPVCRRTFVGLYELRRHFGRKHSEGEKSHVCKKCGKKFYIEVDLRDHEKLCGEPLECKCGMKFAFKCNLVAHKKTHPDCQDSTEEVVGRGSGGAGGHISSTSKVLARGASLRSSGSSISTVFPSSQPPSTCALAASLLNPSSLRSLANVAFRKPFVSETAKSAFRPDLKTEDADFAWFPSSILGVGPMV